MKKIVCTMVRTKDLLNVHKKTVSNTIKQTNGPFVCIYIYIYLYIRVLRYGV